MEGCAEGQSVKHIVENHCFAEADVSDKDDDPGDEARDGGDVGKPIENCGAVAADVQESQASDGESEKDCNPRYAVSVATKEDFGSLVGQSKRV